MENPYGNVRFTTSYIGQQTQPLKPDDSFHCNTIETPKTFTLGGGGEGP